MAKFSQAFLQGLLQPTYQQGLFTAAQQAAQLPSQLKQQQAMEAYRQMDPLQRLDYGIAVAKTPKEIQEAQAAKDAFMKEKAQRSINMLEAARASSDDPTLQRNYERSMAAIAGQYNIDPKGIVGRTDAEELRQLQTAAVQDAANERQLRDQSRAIATAYRGLLSRKDQAGEGVIEQFKKNVQDTSAELYAVIEAIDKTTIESANREMEHQELLESRAEKKSYLSTTSPVAQLETQISNSSLEPAIKKVLKDRIDRLKTQYPDFAKKETWTPAGRKQHDAEYQAINKAFYAEVTDAEALKARERIRMAKLRDSLAKIATKTPPQNIWEQYVPAAEEELGSGFLGFGGPSEEQLNIRAIELARLAMQRDALNAVNAARVANGLEALSLEEVLGTDLSVVTPTEVPEPVEERETTDLTKADSIVGV